MNPLHDFKENYRSSTEGMNLFAKIFIALILAAIIIAAVFAILGMLPYFFR